MLRIVSIAVRVAALLFVVWVGWAFLRPILAALGRHWKQSELGTWGDSFGALNALLTAFGFSAIVATLWLQQKQNEFNEIEQHRQQFDSSFFELIRLLREARDSVIFEHSSLYRNKDGAADDEMREGSQAFLVAWLEFIFWYNAQGKILTRKGMGSLYYNRIHKRYDSNLGPYFRILYTILYRIADDKILSDHEKIKYGRLVRAQLGSYEVALIGLNGLSPVSKDFYNLIVRFRMLKYLPRRSKRRQLLRRAYPRQTFEGSEHSERVSHYLYGPLN